jgi:hypothetical protein
MWRSSKANNRTTPAPWRSGSILLKLGAGAGLVLSTWRRPRRSSADARKRRRRAQHQAHHVHSQDARVSGAECHAKSPLEHPLGGSTTSASERSKLHPPFLAAPPATDGRTSLTARCLQHHAADRGPPQRGPLIGARSLSLPGVFAFCARVHCCNDAGPEPSAGIISEKRDYCRLRSWPPPFGQFHHRGTTGIDCPPPAGPLDMVAGLGGCAIFRR